MGHYLIENMKPINILFLGILAAMPLSAQTSRDSSALHREMLLEREYNPTIRDAVKNGTLPELREPTAPHSKVEFSNYAVPTDFIPAPSLLRPQVWLSDRGISKYKGYITAGLSSRLDVDADAGYTILNTATDYLDLFISHRSSNGLINFLQNDTLQQRFKTTDVMGGFNFSHDFGKIRLNADAKYTFSTFNYTNLRFRYDYNKPDSLFFDTQPLPDMQKNNLAEARIGIASSNTDVLKYKLNFQYRLFNQKDNNTYDAFIDSLSAKEHAFLVDWDVALKVFDNSGFGLAGAFNHYSYPSGSFIPVKDSTSSLSVFSLRPYYFYETENINLVLGARADLASGWMAKNIFAPMVRVNWFVKDNFTLYLNAEGGRADNSRYNTFYENRYLTPNARIIDSRSPLDGAAGLRFTPIAGLGINLFAGYKITFDEHYYAFDSLPDLWLCGTGDSHTGFGGSIVTSYLQLVPAYGDERTFRAGAEITYSFAEVFDMKMAGTWYKREISPKQLIDGELILVDDSLSANIATGAWYKPDAIVNIALGYRLPSVPLHFEASYIGQFGREAGIKKWDKALEMKNVHDLSLRASYTFTPAFSAWLSCRNLLFQKYDQWYGYPAAPFSVMGGLSFLF
jgi:hypothetical protein